VERADRTGAFHCDGAATTVQYVKNTSGEGGGWASRRVKVGRALADVMPMTEHHPRHRQRPNPLVPPPRRTATPPRLTPPTPTPRQRHPTTDVGRALVTSPPLSAPVLLASPVLACLGGRAAR
jgi:hypothetical protein